MSLTGASRLAVVPPWALFGALAAAAFVLIGVGVAPVPLTAAVTVAAAVAVPVGVRLHRPGGRSAWHLLGAGIALCAVPGVVGRPLLVPLYLAAELIVVGALVMLVRRRHARLERATAIDASIITIWFTAITWLYLVGPYASAAREIEIASVWAAVVSGADVLLVAAGSLLMLGALRHIRAAQLLTGSLLGLIVSHLVFLWASMHGGHESGGVGSLAWIVFAGLLGTAVLHPSMRRLSEPAERTGTGLTRARLAVFAGTSLLAPAAAIAQAVLQGPSHVAISIASCVIFLLVLLRVADLVREHEALAQASLRSSFERRLGSLIRNSSDLVCIIEPDTSVSYMSPAALTLVGLEEGDVAGLDWGERVHPDDRPALAAVMGGLEPGASANFGCRVRDAGGAWRDLEALATKLAGDGGREGIAILARDITERRALERRLQHQATHDTLTGLPNRTLLRERVEQALARRRRSGAPLAVIFIDLDDFKNVNDTLGHAAGDAVLREVARRLDGCIRSCDTATRLGGDEFAVLVDDLSDDGHAVGVAQRILEALARPLEVCDRVVEANGSLGIAFAGDGSDSADDLLRDADAAMYLAKDRGKGSYAIYEPAMHAAAVARLELKVDLSRAIADGEIGLVYQPVVDLRSGEIRAYESLARWTHPRRGAVPPCEFIPVAEETGLIVPLGRELLRQACRQAAVLQAACTVGTPLQVSVNVSARQLASEDLVRDVREAVESAGIRPCDLILELTESAMMSDVELAASRLAELRAFGVGLAVDDFGTGYSSLNSIRSFPVDCLKIDRSFVIGLGDPRTRALTEMIVELGGLLGMMVVAEGIEDEAQMRAVLDLGSCFAQGYLIQRPAPAQEVLAHLAEHGRWVRLPAVAV